MKLRLTHTQAGTAIDRRDYDRPDQQREKYLTQTDVDYVTARAKGFVRGYADIELMDDNGQMIDKECIIV